MTFEEFVKQYISLAINDIPEEDYDYIRSLYPRIFNPIPKHRKGVQHTRYEFGRLVSHLGRPYECTDGFLHKEIFEWNDVRDMVSDFEPANDVSIDVMSIL